MSTTKVKQEQLPTQENAGKENTNREKSLINRQQVKGTPFTLIEQTGRWFLVMGDHRITEPTATKESTLKKLESEKWLIQLHMIVIVANRITDENTKAIFRSDVAISELASMPEVRKWQDEKATLNNQ